MDKKKVRQKYFALKELRFSIAHMVLWALLSVAFFTYMAIEIGEKIERGPVYFIIVVIGYALIVIILTLIFTHRFLGPFERLKTELKLIRTGGHHRRFHVRSKDDFYLRSFITEVNKVLEDLEEISGSKEELHKKINSELSHIKTIIERKEISKEELRETVFSFKKRVEDLLRETQKNK
jgi:nitrogen fixation/metabolism regulation signal transduction histidine kinase